MALQMRKLLLATHVMSSVGWMGALAAFLAHAAVGLATDQQQVARAMSLAMEITAWLVILPLCALSFSSGAVQALATCWGLVRGSKHMFDYIERFYNARPP